MTNIKLTHLLAGKTLRAISEQDPCILHFSDNTTLAIQGAHTVTDIPSSPVKAVTELGDDFRLILTVGEIRFILKDPGGSVVARDARSQVTYAG